MLDIIGDDITHLYYSIDLASYVSWPDISGIRRAFECSKIREDFEKEGSEIFLNRNLYS